MTGDVLRSRRIRSFVTRAGRMSPAQQRAIDELGSRFVLPHAPEVLDARATFGRSAPLVLEIGFGMGAATAAIAAQRPDVDFLGVEVHEPGVGALLRRIAGLGLGNVRIVSHDAVEVVEHMIAPGSLAGVHVFFPDPWPKARHHKRRLIQADFVSRLASRLAPGGFLHCATDWEHYAEQMREVLSADPGLVDAGGRDDGWSDPRNPLAERVETKFEARGRRLGHGVWDLVFRRRAGP